MGGIPKPQSLFDIGQGFLNDPLFKKIEKVFAASMSILLGHIETIKTKSLTTSVLPPYVNPLKGNARKTVQERGLSQKRSLSSPKRC